MAKKKIVGFNYLHRHQQTETSLNIDADHVIVDRKEWEEVVDYFHQYPEEVKKLGKARHMIDVYPCYACQGGGCPVCGGYGKIVGS